MAGGLTQRPHMLQSLGLFRLNLMCVCLQYLAERLVRQLADCHLFSGFGDVGSP